MNDAFPDALVEVGTYAWPTGPATSTARDLYRRMIDKLRDQRGGTAALAPEDRTALSSTFFDAEADATLRSHVYAALDRTYADWLDDRDSSGELRVLVTMPSVPRDLVQSWSAQKEIAFAEWGGDLDRSEPLVLSGLSSLVDRSRDGQVALREATAVLAERRAPTLITAQSWTWRYLCHASDINLLPRDIKTLPAFESRALNTLVDAHGPTASIRSLETGDDIRTRDKDGAPGDPYLAMLAARANGCPWAAIALIEEAVSRTDDAEDEEIWLAAPVTRKLPERYEQAARFLLHALLLHDGLEASAARLKLGGDVSTGLLQALARANLIAQDDGRWRCTVAAYPEIRRELDEASFPLDAL